MAFVAAYQYRTIEDCLALAEEKKQPPFLLLLDGIEDPHNLGSILRTADAAGVHGVVIPKRRAVGLTSTVAKTSAGAIEYVPVVRVTNLNRLVDDLKKQGIWIVGSDGNADQSYDQVDYDMPVALVIGNEGTGISQLLKKKCDFLVRLPMHGQVSSLNASVAAGILMYEIVRGRNKK
jgi:23S rRNA (guanosine2251-2'-O)-methyltransferase